MQQLFLPRIAKRAHYVEHYVEEKKRNELHVLGVCVCVFVPKLETWVDSCFTLTQKRYFIDCTIVLSVCTPRYENDEIVLDHGQTNYIQEDTLLLEANSNSAKLSNMPLLIREGNTVLPESPPEVYLNQLTATLSLMPACPR